MKKLFLFALVAIGVSCSNDDDTADFKTSCKCVFKYPDGHTIPSSITDCSYNGRVINATIGPKYVCE